MPKPTAVQKKFTILRDDLNASLIDRSEEIDLTLTATVAQSTLLLIGPPGTAKSYTLESAFRAIKGSNVFTWLMGKFTEPDELFGPVDILALKQGIRRRITKGKLPEAHAVFLDEFWKASTAVGNSLLRAVNERVYDDGSGEKKIPMRVLVAASNEYPQAGELGAMFDRFVLRAEVEYLNSKKSISRLMRTMDYTPKLTTSLSLEELDLAHQEAMSLPFPEEAWKIAEEIVFELIANGIRPSDRRLTKTEQIVKSYAYLQGADHVEPDHLAVLRHMLWNVPGEAVQKTHKIVLKIANPAAMKARDLLLQAESVTEKCLAESIHDVTQREKRADQAKHKLELIRGELQALKNIKEVQTAKEGVEENIQRVLYYSIGAKK